MLKIFLSTIALAWQNIRGNLFHTLLSVLGIVIGVAALVAILCMIDGMEKYAKDQIQTTTSINSIVLQSEPYKMSNGVRIRKDTFAYFDYARFKKLSSLLDTASSRIFIQSTSSAEIESTQKEKAGCLLIGTGEKIHSKIVSGRSLNQEDLIQRNPVAIINKKLESHLQHTGGSIGQFISTPVGTLEIIGVIDEKPENPTLIHPITLLSKEQLRSNLPQVWIDMKNVEQVNPLKSKIQEWLKKEFDTYHADLQIVTNDFRLEQVERGFLLFRIIMGLIVGLSVLVGGIGVMNVLLISVTQRTMEIGVRKALGAKRKDIVSLFLAEAITISGFGSFCGLVVGIVFTLVALPVIKTLTHIPFQVAYTMDTLLVVSIVAILVGIIFGTYPAIRASKLSPVEAIRRE
jgi:putative ABC transport system permease protein